MNAAAGAHTGARGGTPARQRGRRLREVAREQELLLLTAGGPANDDTIRVIAREPIDWHRFLILAELERAVSVVFPRLRDVASDVIPAAALDQMRRLASVSDFAMLYLESRLHDSLAVLHGAGIRVMLLKGAALVHTVYPGFRQRPMSDLDLLVDPSNAQRARRVLLSAGWREIVGGIPDSVYDRHHHLPPLKDSMLPDLQLEIHTALFWDRPFAFDARDLWTRAQPLGNAFPDTFLPDRIHSLLHTCLHFLWSHQGRFGVWRTLRDVDALTRDAAFDWDAFVQAAQSSRGSTSCYWTFRIAQLTAAIPVPASVMERLRPPRNSYLLQAVERHLLRNLFALEFACPSVTLDHALWELAVMPGWSGHGEIRPWDEEPDFVVPRHTPVAVRILPGRERVRRLLASSGYIGALLRPRR